MTYTLTDIVRHIRLRTTATPALNTYEMDDQTPSRREVGKRKLTPTFRFGFDLSRLGVVVGEAVCDGWQRVLV